MHHLCPIGISLPARPIDDDFITVRGRVNGGLNVYGDGVLVSSTDGGAGTYDDVADGANPLLIYTIVQARVHNSQLYNRELSLSEIKALYDQGPYV